MKKRTIWTSEIDPESVEALETEKGLSHSAAYEAACESNTEWLYDVRSNLKMEVPNPILAIADLGLWNGRRSGYKMLSGSTVADIFTVHCGDFVTYYADAYNVRCVDIHHDGTNYYVFRELRDPEGSCQPLLDAIYCGKDYKALLKRYTKSLLPYVADVYGWPMAGRKPGIA